MASMTMLAQKNEPSLADAPILPLRNGRVSRAIFSARAGLPLAWSAGV